MNTLEAAVVVLCAWNVFLTARSYYQSAVIDRLISLGERHNDTLADHNKALSHLSK